jgi:hypothetical protein
VARGKSKQKKKVVTVIARKLAGFLWELYHEWKTPGSSSPRVVRRANAPAPTPPAARDGCPAEGGGAAP